jgi:hypothetical protein
MLAKNKESNIIKASRARQPWLHLRRFTGAIMDSASMVAVHQHVATQQGELERLTAEEAASRKAVANDAGMLRHLAAQAQSSRAVARRMEQEAKRSDSVLRSRTWVLQKALSRVGARSRLISASFASLQATALRLSSSFSTDSLGDAIVSSLSERLAAIRSDRSQLRDRLRTTAERTQTALKGRQDASKAACKAKITLAVLQSRQDMSKEEAASRQARVVQLKAKLSALDPDRRAAHARLQQSVSRQRAAEAASKHYRKAHSRRMQQVADANARLQRAVGITFPVPAALQPACV